MVARIQFKGAKFSREYRSNDKSAIDSETEGDQISKEYFQFKNEVYRSKDALNDEHELLLIEKRTLED